MKKGRLTALFLTMAAAAALFCGCSSTKQQQEDIVILYTGDVHCAMDDNIGYAGLVAYKKQMAEKTPYITLVDCGDAIQGDAIGLISKGEYPLQLMNRTGYDLAVPGNHEFDYGMERLNTVLKEAKAQYLGCNIRYSGDGENALAAVKPYQIESYGDTEVAFIGVCTPENITSSTPAYFMDEAGRFIYDFYGEGNGSDFYRQVQETVDECRSKGTDYIILLAHLGMDEDSAPFRSVDLIEHTNGVDAVLDGHSHSVIPCQIVKDQSGKEVLLSSTGTELAYIGQLTIMPGGMLTTGLISYSEKDEETAAYIREIQDNFAEDMNKVVGQSEIPLSISSETGIRMVRSRETAIGDFCADAYRTVSGADIAIVNGGGIRADLPAGDITLGNLIDVHPYGNSLCVAEVSGQDILDALEMANRAVQAKYCDGENAIGENGGFLQVSGITFTVDTSIASPVVLDENEIFVSCGDVRRVKNVMVLQKDGSYAPLDPNRTYSLASQNYLLKKGGDGLRMFMDKPLTIDDGLTDYVILETYIRDTLGGVIGKEYESPQGRIVIQ